MNVYITSSSPSLTFYAVPLFSKHPCFGLFFLDWILLCVCANKQEQNKNNLLQAFVSSHNSQIKLSIVIITQTEFSKNGYRGHQPSNNEKYMQINCIETAAACNACFENDSHLTAFFSGCLVSYMAIGTSASGKKIMPAINFKGCQNNEHRLEL